MGYREHDGCDVRNMLSELGFFTFYKLLFFVNGNAARDRGFDWFPGVRC